VIVQLAFISAPVRDLVIRVPVHWAAMLASGHSRGTTLGPENQAAALSGGGAA
jgi:hypothetical protein